MCLNWFDFFAHELQYTYHGIGPKNGLNNVNGRLDRSYAAATARCTVTKQTKQMKDLSGSVRLNYLLKLVIGDHRGAPSGQNVHYANNNFNTGETATDEKS